MPREPLKKEVKARVSLTLYRQVVRIAEARDITPSDVVREAVSAYLERQRSYPPPRPTSDHVRESHTEPDPLPAQRHHVLSSDQLAAAAAAGAAAARSYLESQSPPPSGTAASPSDDKSAPAPDAPAESSSLPPPPAPAHKTP